MDLELSYLFRLLGPVARQRMTIELVQLGTTDTLEVAFTEVTEVAPPGNWTSAADRIWRLDTPHAADLLADVADHPPIAPQLVTLGSASESGQIYLDLASAAGINLVGDESTNEWLSNTLTEVANRTTGPDSMVYLVADEQFASLHVPDAVERASEERVIEIALGHLDSRPNRSLSSALGHRTDNPESQSIMIALVTAPTDPRWDQIAAAPSVAVLSTVHRFDSGRNIIVHDGSVNVPSLGIGEPPPTTGSVQPPTMEDVSSSTASEGADHDPSKASSSIAEPAEPEPDSDWELPTWPVMINILGAPHATRNGTPIKLTPQQLSALALIATKREIPAHDFRRSIWGDQDDVSSERVRDMLSQLRKKTGGLRVIPKREDGLVCAGDDLGSDTLIFDVLVDRAVLVPDHRDELFCTALDLVSGRILDYSSSDSQWWRWSEIAFGATDWTAKATEVAVALARSRLEASDPAAARDIAERGLVADPLNAALTELLMEAYADLGTLEPARRAYESHARSLDMADLGGAGAETRRVLEQIRAAADDAADDANPVS